MQIPSAETSINGIVNTFHNIAASHAPVAIGLGTVLTPFPEITIAWNGIILEKEQLYIDIFLLPGYQRMSVGTQKFDEAEGNIETSTEERGGGSGDPSYEDHIHNIDDEYTMTLEGAYSETFIASDCGIVPGDLVTLLPLEGAQKFVVLGKVIYLPEYKLGDEDDEDGERPVDGGSNTS